MKAPKEVGVLLRAVGFFKREAGIAVTLHPGIQRLIARCYADGLRQGDTNRLAADGGDILFIVIRQPHEGICPKADWLIGINATRLFSVLYNHTLNVGRVQTPTLKMLVDRDAAITTFKKEKYYHVRLALSGAESASKKLSDRSEADRLKAACEASKAVCTSLVKEKKTTAPPKLFDLTSLQREANRLFGYTAKQTLDLAQALYEKDFLLIREQTAHF